MSLVQSKHLNYIQLTQNTYNKIVYVSVILFLLSSWHTQYSPNSKESSKHQVYCISLTITCMFFGSYFYWHYLDIQYVSLTRYEVACCDGNISLHQCRISPIGNTHLVWLGFEWLNFKVLLQLFVYLHPYAHTWTCGQDKTDRAAMPTVVVWSMESKDWQQAIHSQTLTRLDLRWQHHQRVGCKDRRFPPTVHEMLTLSWNKKQNTNSWGSTPFWHTSEIFCSISLSKELYIFIFIHVKCLGAALWFCTEFLVLTTNQLIPCQGCTQIQTN